jgi:cysteine desulfurase
MKPIYLDYAATTPVDPRVIQKMNECLSIDGYFGNSASRSHAFGWQAEEQVDIARHQVADSIKADSREIIWTSGATESNNLAIKGCAQVAKKGHIITSAFEHKSVLDVCSFLESQGILVTYLKPSKQGYITSEQVEEAIQKETFLISLMMANNELGSIQPIEAIAEIAKKHHILFHVDAVQAMGKVKIDLKTVPIDFMSFSAHKVYGPKGMGALYVRLNQQSDLLAQIHGGGHERHLRSGTLATHQIAGMGMAFEIADHEFLKHNEQLMKRKKELLSGLLNMPGIILNGPSRFDHQSPQKTLPTTINIQFLGIDSDLLMTAFKDIALSSGSACTSMKVEPSYVLTSIGLSDQAAYSSLRLSWGRFSTQKEIERAIKTIKKGFLRLKQLAL